ncbi:serine/threonine-protein kinase [Plantactinospora sp. CA-290183]|uniref:serine/threonine-protein kinase n=1 Tax=Plantactinospora sp. CA-290183 TaxID=3240006 RepID=UPI003D8A3894
MDTTSEPFPARPELIRQLPGYRLVRQLSQTAMSSVYLAEEIALGRRVALKILGPELARQPGFRARFRRETEMVARLDHPNVIPVYTAGESADLCYLTMRYVEGSDLRRILLDEGPLDVGRAIAILRQVAAALDVAHEAGLVHRDVKPGNVLVDRRTGQVYLTDFGIARDGATQTLTPDGEVIGTPAYIAPEQIRNSRVDHRADVYALGCVAYECLTGQKPFVRADPLSVLWAHAQDPPPPATGLRPGLPAAVDTVLARALAKSPEDRHPDCTTLIAELAAATAAPVPTGPVAAAAGRASVPVPAAPPGGGRWRRLAGAGSALARRHRTVTLVTALLLVAGTVTGAALVVARNAGTPGPDVRAAVPAPLRAGCREVDGTGGGAIASLLCRDGDYEARVRVFADRAGVDREYQQAVRESGIAPGTGDCAAAVGAEHRYPSAGTPKGRVLCFSRDGPTTLIWTHDAARTVTRVESAMDGAAVYRAWAGWTGSALPFPTADEKALMELVAEGDCRRPPAGSLDGFGALLAAVECTPRYHGARTVSYYRYANLGELQRTFDARADAAAVPTGKYCADGEAEGFRGNRRYDVRSIELGGLLCHPGPQSTLVLEWSVEPLLVLGRAVGTDAEDLPAWWSARRGPPLETVLAAVNAQADPPFPTAAERALLDRVPAASRSNCLRPPTEQVRNNVPGDTEVVGVVCGPTGGARIVFYYQFPDAAAMRANYQAGAVPEWPDCTPDAPGFRGEQPYARGGSTGRLLCHRSDGAGYYLVWTDERRAIQVFAFQGSDPEVLLDWWRHDAGPL